MLNSIKEKINSIWGQAPTQASHRLNEINSTVTNAGLVADVDDLHIILDEAKTGYTAPLFDLYNSLIATDTHIQTEFSKRKMAVLGDQVTVIPQSSQEVDEGILDLVRSKVLEHPGFHDACRHLLDSTLYPVSVVEKVFKMSSSGVNYEISELKPVPYELLDFTQSKMRIQDVGEDGRLLNTFHEADPNRYIVHRGHMLSDRDWDGGPMRSLVFWSLFGTMNRDWWARFLERYGSPFLVAKYDSNDDSSRVALRGVVESATRLFGVVMSKDTELELQQASTANTDAYEKFHAMAQREKSKVIVGQTLSSEAQATGLGSGVANAHESVRSELRQMDSTRLGITISSQLISQFLYINNIHFAAPRVTWTRDDPSMAAHTGALIAQLSSANLTPSDDALKIIEERLGFEVVRAATPALDASPRLLSTQSRLYQDRAQRADEANESVAIKSSAGLSRSVRAGSGFY